VLMTPTHYVFTNLGDSRTLLCRDGRLGFQTRDHKPTLPQERQRIRNAGGYVINARVDGGLAISRAFGDFDYKMRSDLSSLQQKVGGDAGSGHMAEGLVDGSVAQGLEGDRGPTSCLHILPSPFPLPCLANRLIPQVLADPEVTVMTRDYAQDDFILLACDGIFDVMSNVTCIKFVQTKLKKNPTNPKAACCALLKRCLELGSRDNMSAVLVLFNKAYEPVMVAAKMARSDAQVG